MPLLEQRSARFLKRARSHHQRRWRIRRSGVVHPLHFRCKSFIFWLRGSNVYRGADFHQREKLRRGFAVQPNTSVCAWRGMNKTLMKTVARRKLTPESHRITNIAAGNIRTRIRGNNAAALDSEAVRARAFLFLLRVNCETAVRRWLRRDANRTGDRHQATVAFHHVNVFFCERNLHLHSRRVVWTIRCHMVRLAGSHTPCCATGEEQKRTASSQQNESGDMSHNVHTGEARRHFVNHQPVAVSWRLPSSRWSISSNGRIKFA